MFHKIEVSRRRIADDVHGQILAAIHRGLIGPAERIVQEKLAEQLQVSRTPIREALLRLEQEGTLVASDRGGFVIRVATPREVREIYDAREAIEGHCAGMLAREATSERLAGIETLIRLNEARSQDSTQAYYDANRTIHRAFVMATDNQYLLEMFDAMWNRNLSYATFRTLNRDQLRATLTGHLDLLDAVRSRDPAYASAVMQDHIRKGMQLQLSAMEALDPA